MLVSARAVQERDREGKEPGLSWKGLRPSTISSAGIREQGNGVTAIPYRRTDGRVFRWRYKRKTGGEWWGSGTSQCLFGLETLPNAHVSGASVVCLCEGESDTLALRETIGEACPRVFALGCPGASSYREDWEVYLEPFDHVIVLGDGDDAGHEFTRRVQWLFPRAGTANMPDGDDVRSMIQGVSADSVLEMIRECVELEAMIREHFPWDGKTPSARAMVERGEVMPLLDEQATIDVDGEAVPVTPIRRDSL